MGCCASQRHQNVMKPDYFDENKHNDTKCNKKNDYSIHIIRAYVHEIRILLQNKYINNDNNNSEYYQIFVMGIPKVINEIICKYYLRYTVYGINIKESLILQLNELEQLVYDTNKIFHNGNDKIYVQDFENRMHAFICQYPQHPQHPQHTNHNHNNSYSSHNSNDTMLHNDNDKQALFETYCFRDFMHINEIDLIRHSLYNEHRKVIKLKNGSIYTQYNKNANGWNQIYLFKWKNINIIDIDCGMSHTLFLTNHGHVYSHGKNDEGQCGIVKTKNGVRVNDSYIKNPTLIETFIQKECKIISISCGYGHNVCIEEKNNNVWMFGRNKVWQCNPESNSNYIDDDEIGGYYASYRTEIYLPRLNQSFVDTKIIKAKCGNDFTVLLSEKGFLYGLGNVNGEINLEIKGVSLLSKKNNIINFHCSSSYCVWITDKLKIYSFESKQSWWYGWNRNRTFTSEWNGNKPQQWVHEIFNFSPSAIDQILVGKDSFVLFMN